MKFTLTLTLSLEGRGENAEWEIEMCTGFFPLPYGERAG